MVLAPEPSSGLARPFPPFSRRGKEEMVISFPAIRGVKIFFFLWLLRDFLSPTLFFVLLHFSQRRRSFLQLGILDLIPV